MSFNKIIILTISIAIGLLVASTYFINRYADKYYPINSPYPLTGSNDENIEKLYVYRDNLNARIDFYFRVKARIMFFVLMPLFGIKLILEFLSIYFKSKP